MQNTLGNQSGAAGVLAPVAAFSAASRPREQADTVAAYVVAGVLLLMGCVFLMAANKEVGPILFGLVFLATGLMLVRIPGVSHPMARRAFVLAFSVCVFVAGVAQMYSLHYFGNVQSTTDAVNTFYPLSAGNRSSVSDLELVVNSPLAVRTWRIVYGASHTIGVGDGPWVGVMWNCFLVGLAAAITNLAAGFLWGDDSARLRRLGTMFTLCGYFWLFGAVHIRDSWVLLMNACLLWAFLRLFAKRNVSSFVLAAALILIVALVTAGIRTGNLLLIAFICTVALVVYFSKGHKMSLLFLLPLVAIALLFTSSFLVDYASSSTAFADQSRQRYGAGAGGGIAGQSLGAAFVVRQSLPVRIVTGSVSLVMSPIPSWANFRLALSEYHWLMGLGGFSMIFLMPRGLVGITMGVRSYFAPQTSNVSGGFLVAFFFMGLLSIVATSLELRHFAPFIPALLILAATPDKKDPATRVKLARAGVFWFGLWGLAHLAWTALKSF